jgi:hypothetical protein
VMARILDLSDVGVDEILGWYRKIVEGVHQVTAGFEVPATARRAFRDLGTAVVGKGPSAGSRWWHGRGAVGRRGRLQRRGPVVRWIVTSETAPPSPFGISSKTPAWGWRSHRTEAW